MNNIMNDTIYAFARPLYVMLKPVGPRCNLGCSYCYYLEKRLWAMSDDAPVMSEQLLENFVKEYLAAQTSRDVFFVWHGGEPLLRPVAFYEKAVELQRRYGGELHIENCIQTNGTLLTEEWCRFFRENGFLVGVSIDGPQFLHDRYRRTADRRPSFESVMQGIDLLRRHGVEWNAMATVNRFNADHPHAFYRFFRDLGCRYLQFTPVVEPAPDDGRQQIVTEESVTPGQWGNFLCQLFDEWAEHDVGQISIQLFEATLANWMGVTPGLCMLSRHCGHAGVMEANGDVYSCDHFVFPSYRLGNLTRQSLTSMMYSEPQRSFGQRKMTGLPRQCHECRFLFACNGECPKNRLLSDRYGQPGLNYLCEGYLQYFAHVAPFMEQMAQTDINQTERNKEKPL